MSGPLAGVPFNTVPRNFDTRLEPHLFRVLLLRRLRLPLPPTVHLCRCGHHQDSFQDVFAVRVMLMSPVDVGAPPVPIVASEVWAGKFSRSEGGQVSHTVSRIAGSTSGVIWQMAHRQRHTPSTWLAANFSVNSGIARRERRSHALMPSIDNTVGIGIRFCESLQHVSHALCACSSLQRTLKRCCVPLNRWHELLMVRPTNRRNTSPTTMPRSGA